MQVIRFLVGVVLTSAPPAFGVADDKPQHNPAPAESKLIAKPDAFKTLVNPKCSHCVDEAKRRAGELRDDDRVLAWIRGYSQGGGIPARFFLVPYRVISDTYGVFVFDAEAGYMRGFEPSLDFEFYGWRNGVMVMRNTKDGTLYSCLSGRAFDGPKKSEQLKPVPTVQTDWGYWLRNYPGAVAYHMFEQYQPIELPKLESTDALSTIGRLDDRLPGRVPVIGLALGDNAKAYPLVSFREKDGGIIDLDKTSVITDKLGDQHVVVLWLQQTHTAAIYAPDVEGTEPRQSVALAVDAKLADAPFLDSKTGSHFDIVGRAVDGPLKGKTLRWLPGIQCKWYAWAAEYPKTDLYGARETGKARSSAAQRPGYVVSQDSKLPDRVATARAALEGVIVDARAITETNALNWQKQGFNTVAAVLDERHDSATTAAAAKAADTASLKLYYWIEVARNPTMAVEHPDWMASLGMHADWHERFPDTPMPTKGQVAKAFPWVSIGYREAFDAQLARVAKLLEQAAGPYRGILLNDLQGGPASCGCGNLQCRWAIDYHVPATGTKLDGDDFAARFVGEVQKLVGDKTVIPVWTTECEDEDLPVDKRPAGSSTTGYCGSVGCAVGTCPKAFTRQWSSLASSVRGPIGVLATHREFARDRPEYGDAAGWIARAVEYLDVVPPKHGGQPVAHNRLWLVVQGHGVTDAERSAARAAAARTGAGAVLVAFTRLDQSYEPRIVPAK